MPTALRPGRSGRTPEGAILLPILCLPGYKLYVHMERKSPLLCVVAHAAARAVDQGADRSGVGAFRARCEVWRALWTDAGEAQRLR